MIQHFYLIRHGEKVRMAGDPPLTERGQLQARTTGAFLATLSPALILASPLLRTQQTAIFLSEACGVPVQTESLLRERANWGDDPLQPFEEFITMWHKSSQDRSWQPPVGDSSITAGNRMRFVIENLTPEYEHTVLVSHGGTISDFLLNVFSPAELDSLHPGFSLMRDSLVKECSFTHLSIDSQTQKYVLHSVANVNHLLDIS